MAWIDDAITQLMLQMQLPQIMGGGQQGDPFVDEAEIGRAPLDRVINPSFAGRHQMGERLHPNAMGILLDPNRPQPPGDEVIYGEPSRFNNPGIVTPSVSRGEKNPMPLDTPMPGVAADENRRGIWERTLREDRGEVDPQLGNMVTRISNTGDPVTQLMLQMQLQQLMGGGDNSQFMQRPPLAGDVPPASRPEAWFENPSWLQGYPPEPPEAMQGMLMQRPAPGPPGLSGSYSGHGSFLRDYFGPNSPLRGTYRHTVPF